MRLHHAAATFVGWYHWTARLLFGEGPVGSDRFFMSLVRRSRHVCNAAPEVIEPEFHYLCHVNPSKNRESITAL